MGEVAKLMSAYKVKPNHTTYGLWMTLERKDLSHVENVFKYVDSNFFPLFFLILLQRRQSRWHWDGTFVIYAVFKVRPHEQWWAKSAWYINLSSKFPPRVIHNLEILREMDKEAGPLTRAQMALLIRTRSCCRHNIEITESHRSCRFTDFILERDVRTSLCEADQSRPTYWSDYFKNGRQWA
jgi:hypothetical protein